jgi:putative transposase
MDRRRNDCQDTEPYWSCLVRRQPRPGSNIAVTLKKVLPLASVMILIGGGLIRSNGGWANVKVERRAKIYEKADERILGDGDFVQEVLARAEEKLKRRYADEMELINSLKRLTTKFEILT